MSTNHDALDSIRLARFVRTHRIWDTIATVILIYDYALTFSREVRAFWWTPLSSIKILYFLNRYLSLFTAVPLFITSFLPSTGSSTKRCHALSLLHSIVLALIQLIAAVVLLMRTRALYEGSRKVLISLTTALVVVFGLAIYLSLSGHSGGSVPFSAGCISLSTKDSSNRLAIAWGLSTLYDTCIFAMTVYKSFEMRVNGDQVLSAQPVVRLILRDGTLYFALLFSANLVNILTYLLGDSLSRGIGSTLANNISATMINRLMIHLREHAGKTRGTPTGISSESTTLDFSAPRRTSQSRVRDDRFTRISRTYGSVHDIEEIELSDRNVPVSKTYSIIIQ